MRKAQHQIQGMGSVNDLSYHWEQFLLALFEKFCWKGIKMRRLRCRCLTSRTSSSDTAENLGSEVLQLSLKPTDNSVGSVESSSWRRRVLLSLENETKQFATSETDV